MGLTQDDFDLKSLIGRNYTEMNCWDLVREFYKKVFGVELKSYVKEVPKEKMAINHLITSNVGDFELVDRNQKRFGDLMLIKIFGVEVHIGVYLGNDRFLHSSEKTGSAIDVASRWDKLVTGYYRLKGIAE